MPLSSWGCFGRSKDIRYIWLKQRDYCGRASTRYVSEGISLEDSIFKKCQWRSNCNHSSSKSFVRRAHNIKQRDAMKVTCGSTLLLLAGCNAFSPSSTLRYVVTIKRMEWNKREGKKMHIPLAMKKMGCSFESVVESYVIWVLMGHESCHFCGCVNGQDTVVGSWHKMV